MALMSTDLAGVRERLRKAPHRSTDAQSTEGLTRMSFNVRLVLRAYGNSTRAGVETPAPMISAAAAVERLSSVL